MNLEEKYKSFSKTKENRKKHIKTERKTNFLSMSVWGYPSLEASPSHDTIHLQVFINQYISIYQ